MPPTVARLDYQRPGETNYLLYLNDLALQDLIVGSMDRDLTDSGRRVVHDSFGQTLNIGRIVMAVKRLRQGNPDVSEMDAFVYEASDLAYVLSSDSQRSDIDMRECRMRMPRKGTYILGGIHVLREATKSGNVIVNPPYSPTADQCYVSYA